jgi:hypothetical protein
MRPYRALSSIKSPVKNKTLHQEQFIMAISVSLDSFTTAAQNARAADTALRVTGDGKVRKSSGLREFFTTKAAHRAVMRQFLDALKARYGEQIANMAALNLEIRSGKPLTARKIHAVVGAAEGIRQSMVAFLSTSGDHNIYAAINAWQAAHPMEPYLTPTERQVAVGRMADDILASKPVCHNPEAMFQAVLNADLRPWLTGNVEIPDAPTGAAAVATRADARLAFAEDLMSTPGGQLLLNLDQARGGNAVPVFEKDLHRNMDLTLGGNRVPNRPGDLPEPRSDNPARAVAQNGYEMLARFIAGPQARLAELPEAQQRQVYLLAGLCNQEMEKPAQRHAQRGMLGDAAERIGFGNAPDGTPARIHLERNGDGNFALHYSREFSFTVVDTGEQTTMLDPARSVQEVSVELVITPDELERLAALDWTGVSPGNLPDTHRMNFAECRLDSSLALYTAAAQEAERDADMNDFMNEIEEQDADTNDFMNELLNKIDDVGMNNFLDEIFPGDGKQPSAISPAFRAICEDILRGQEGFEIARLGFDIARLNPSNHQPQVRAAIEELNRVAKSEGRVPSPDELHAVARQALARELTALSGALATIDTLPEPANPARPSAGEFSPAQKTLMKAAALRHDVRDVDALGALMEAARGVGNDMHALATPLATPHLLAQHANHLAVAYAQALPNLGKQPPYDSVNILLELAAGDAGLSAGQLANLAANLESDAASTVAGAFLLGAEGSLPNLPPERRNVMGLAYGMTRALHDTADALAHGGRFEPQALLFTDPTPLHRVPGGSNGCMEVLSMMVGPGVISEGAQALAKHEPPFNRAQWNILLPIADRLARGPSGNIVAHWLAFGGEALLAAAQANRGRPLDNGQIWRVLTGESMPRGVTDDDFSDRLYAWVFEHSGSESERDFVLNFGAASFMGGLTPKRMLELRQPGAKLTLADIHADTRMSSLTDNNLDNAYFSFRKDFFRLAGSVPVTLTDVRGNGHIIYNQLNAEDHPNRPLNSVADAHPDFQTIFRYVNEMTHDREAQTARVLQAFTQSALGLIPCAGALGTAQIDGIRASYAFSATEQPNGDVVVDIRHDPTSEREEEPVPIHAWIQYTIRPDGAHECTALEMLRTDR